MLRYRRALTVVVLAVASLLPVTVASANGGDDGGVGVFNGGGTVLPGLTTTPTNQIYAMDGIALLANTTGAGYIPCVMGGASFGAGETIAEGAGFMHFTCGAFTANLCAYTRVALVLSFACADTGTGVIANGVFPLVPAQVPPAKMTSYGVLVGTITVARVTANLCINNCG